MLTRLLKNVLELLTLLGPVWSLSSYVLEQNTTGSRELKLGTQWKGGSENSCPGTVRLCSKSDGSWRSLFLTERTPLGGPSLSDFHYGQQGFCSTHPCPLYTWEKQAAFFSAPFRNSPAIIKNHSIHQPLLNDSRCYLMIQERSPLPHRKRKTNGIEWGRTGFWFGFICLDLLFICSHNIQIPKYSPSFRSDFYTSSSFRSRWRELAAHCPCGRQILHGG